jgi:hypothetical protein
MNNQYKSFRITPTIPNPDGKKWWQFRKMSRDQYGRAFWICILLVYVLPMIGLGGIIPSAFVLGGLVSGIIWIILTIKSKHSK